MKIQLSSIIDNIFENIIKKANNRPIWIPLSGGLDSRLVLCKLHEKGYTNLNCFSYGLKNNSECLIAEKIAKALNTRWKFIEIKKKNYLNFIHLKKKKSLIDIQIIYR